MIKNNSFISNDNKEFFNLIENRLRDKDFEIKKDIEITLYKVDLLAVKSSVEISKFGKISRIILVTYLENVDIETIQQYSKNSTKYALDNRNSLLPRGLGGSLLYVPVIVSDDFEENIKQWILKTLAEKHWAAFEFPVLISLKEKKLYYCKKTPFWGAAYYKGFRRFIEENLSF